MLEDGDEKASTPQIADREGGKSAVPVEIGAEQGSGGSDGFFPQHRLQEGRWEVDDTDRIANEWKRCRETLDSRLIGRQRKMAELTARGDPYLREMDRQPLLQAPGSG